MGQDAPSVASIVIAALVALVGVINLRLGAAKQRREDDIGRAKFGYELIDAIFDDKKVMVLLEGIDATPGNLLDVERVLQPTGEKLSHKDQAIEDGVDSLLVYFDRIEHAITADLTTFETIRTPISYYVDFFAQIKGSFSEYIERNRYKRVIDFLNRFDSWKNAVE